MLYDLVVYIWLIVLFFLGLLILPFLAIIVLSVVGAVIISVIELIKFKIFCFKNRDCRFKQGKSPP